MKKIALVTGSSRGIGKAIALKLATMGCKVVIHGSSFGDELKQTEKELKILDSWLMTSCFDVSNKKITDIHIEKIFNKFGRIDILINNAGITKDRTFLKMSESEWDDVIKTNLYGVFFVTQKIVPKMIENKFGRIINISSIVGQKGNFGQSNYAASKSGLLGLTKSLSKELAKHNITVNAVCPGLIDTLMTNKIPTIYKDQLLSQIAIQRIGTTKEVASIVAYLASDESSYITGSVIDINGGWL